MRRVLVIAGGGVSSSTVTLKLIELMKIADVIYVETYTSPSSQWLLEIASRHGKHVVRASRRMLEEDGWRIVEEARSKLVLVVSPGDPLVATTHQSLLAEASARGVETAYVPGVSGVTAAKAYSGLSYYRFGRTVTAPGPWRGVKPTTTLAVVYGNLCVDAHTLILLDVGDDGEMLSPSTASSTLLEHEREVSETLGTRPLLEETPVILVVSAGREDARIELFDSPRDLAGSGVDAGGPASIIAPAPLTRIEAWILESRVRRKLGERWVKRPYGRRDACSSYEKLLDWLLAA